MKSCTGESVCILMMNSPNIPAYAHKAAILNYMYASRHGYNFVVERCPRPQDVQTPWMWDGDGGNEYLFVWSKPVLVRKHLPFYAYVLYIDSDAVVVDKDKTVEDFARQYVTGATCVVAAQDCKTAGDCWVAEDLNAGVMLFKNSPDTLALLDAWFEATNDTCKHTLYLHPREQACLNLLRRQNKRYDELVHIVPVSVMGGHDGTWIRHYADTSTPESERMLASQLRDEITPYLGGHAPGEVVEGFSGSTHPTAFF